jgi:ABC-type multidrug transport system fused ATPase/permease subunit
MQIMARGWRLIRSKVRSRLSKSAIGQSLLMLSARDLRKLGLVTLIQVLLGLLDLAGVAAIGVLGALAVRGVASQQPGTRVQQVLEFLNISELTFQSQVAILGVAAALLLIGRTLLTVVFTRRTLLYLSRRSAKIAIKIFKDFISQDLTKIKSLSSQEVYFGITKGVDSVTVGVIGNIITLISDFSLVLIMFTGLLIVDTSIALSSVLVFGLIGIVIYKLLHKRARHLGALESELAIANNERISEVLGSFREIVVRNRRAHYLEKISDIRFSMAKATAEIAFLPSISKYVIESTVVLGTLLISAIQFQLEDATRAVATLTVFMAAAARIAPASMRIQQGMISMKSSLGAANPTLRLIDSIQITSVFESSQKKVSSGHDGFVGSVNVSKVSLIYPGSNVKALNQVSFEVLPNSSIAIVGPSGGGKTSLVDVMLGLISPTEGRVEISGLNALDCFSNWPGAVAYVPQDTMIVNGTLRDNVALGYSGAEATDDLVFRALRLAQLEEFARDLPNGLDTQLGERGSRISGGQRQRLGIARALFTQPRLLFLDEATSALDAQTEHDFTSAINQLKGSLTLITIAHRLTTIKDADNILYLDNGSIIATGSLQEVRDQIPNFDGQAKLMGL